MDAQNLLAQLPDEVAEEVVDTLARSRHVRIERIVSRGQASPADFWYDQEESEWVLVMRGAARIEFEDRMLEMQAGDYVEIAPHVRHRVAWTSPDEPTVWLAVFYS